MTAATQIVDGCRVPSTSRTVLAWDHDGRAFLAEFHDPIVVTAWEVVPDDAYWHDPGEVLPPWARGRLPVNPDGEAYAPPGWFAVAGPHVEEFLDYALVHVGGPDAVLVWQDVVSPAPARAAAVRRMQRAGREAPPEAGPAETVRIALAQLPHADRFPPMPGDVVRAWAEGVVVTEEEE